jgi:hypothetical protein
VPIRGLSAVGDGLAVLELLREIVTMALVDNAAGPTFNYCGISITSG